MMKINEDNSNKDIIKKVLDLYLFKYRLLDTEIQNKTTPENWIYNHWDDYEDVFPYKKIIKNDV